jgi:hypothetical protein
MLKPSIFVLAAALLSSGCSIHPVPADVTGVDTKDIVKQIRCETREALADEIKAQLKKWAAAGSPEAETLSRRYESDPAAIEDFHPGLFPGPSYVQVRSFIKLFADSAIAYNFDLTMTENNDLTADINLLKPLTTPRFTLGISAGALRKRTNQRTFTITDTFGYLVARLNRKNRYGERYCDGKIVRENYVYPIAGRIGVDKTVTTFLELTVFGSLGGEEGKGPPTMADKLTFTTAVNVSANPRIEFTPVTNSFQLANAALTASADRTDKHEVTIGLSIGGVGLDELDSFRSFAFSPNRGGGATAGGRSPRFGLYRGERVTGGGTPAERSAVEAIDQLKRREMQLIAPQ